LPPPKIVGRGIQSKLIVTETGKRLYASTLPYQEQMQKLTGKHVQDVSLVKQSEFKKPYLENSYPEMEHFQYPPGPDPIRPPGPGGFDNDCKVGYEVAGAVVGWRICAPSDDCAGWIFTCAHKIVSFTCGNCHIARMEQLSGDRLLVVICSGDDKLAVKYKTNDGVDHIFGPNRTCLGTDPDPTCLGSGCTNCKATPDIGYSTQQMSTTGALSTQNLNADGGGGGPYTWSIISGGGTLSKLVTTNNEMTLYTAPSSNPDCVYNPTIQVKDFCGHEKTLKLAINAKTGSFVAWGSSHCDKDNLCIKVADLRCQVLVSINKYNCDSSFAGNSGCAGSDFGCGGTACPCANGCPAPGQLDCAGQAAVSCPTYTPIGAHIDLRDPTTKLAGCCPVGLL
jgi:hypothetical protein